MVKDLKDKRVKKAVVYTVIGIDTNAQKSLLGYYFFFGSENKSTWMEVFQDLYQFSYIHSLYNIVIRNQRFDLLFCI